jgi:hypothetical protein
MDHSNARSSTVSDPSNDRAEVLQLDGWYEPDEAQRGDYVTDPNGDGYGLTATADEDHWRCGPSRLVRVQILKSADREAATKLLRDLAEWLAGPGTPWGLLDPPRDVLDHPRLHIVK